MKIKEIYESFDKIGSVVFSTIDDGFPETRIAHFFAYDDRGLYFRTMTTKPFYHQLITSKRVSVCGLNAKTEINHDNNGMPTFEPGYSIRVTGECQEVDIEYMEVQALKDKNFLMDLMILKNILQQECLY